MAPDRCGYRYCAYYCEENAWHLAGGAQLALGARSVVFITNAARRALLFEQRAAPGNFVLWDYHVVVLVRGEQAQWVYDLDSLLPFPTSLETYARRTFGDSTAFPKEVQSRFRILPGQDFVRNFSSDRSHMRAPNGSWLRPPPPWPVIGGTRSDNWSLSDLLDLNRPRPGEWLDLPGLLGLLD